MILRRSLRWVGSVLFVGGLFLVAAPAHAHEGEESDSESVSPQRQSGLGPDATARPRADDGQREGGGPWSGNVL